VLIDVSQLTTKALQDVLAASKAPVVASHSGVRSIVDVSRNLSDEELKAIADKGGVVQIVAFSAYLAPLPQSVQEEVARVNAKYDIRPDRSTGSADPAKFKAWSTEFHEALAKAPKATVSQYVDSIDYAVQKISIDHVGIASDFNHGGGVIGWKDESEAPNVTAELLRRGYTNDQIAKLWGGNFLRVWGEAQQHATVARDKHSRRAAGE
jgi:membrane dipeptidase